MVKKTALTVLLLFLAANVQAQEIKTILNGVTWQNGVGYAIKSKGVNYISTVDVASWKALSLEAGYTAQTDPIDNAAIVLLSLKLLDMKDVIKFPILDQISFRPGIGVAIGPISKGDAKTDILATLSVISKKF